MTVETKTIAGAALIVVNLAAFIISALVLTNCEFMELHLNGSYVSQDYAIGLFSAHYDGKCHDYTSSQEKKFDGYIRASRAFGVLACLLVAFGLIASGLGMLISEERSASMAWNSARFGFWPAALFATGMTFLLFNNNADLFGGVTTKEFCSSDYPTNCGVGTGAALAISNMVLLLLMFGVGFFVPAPVMQASPSSGQGEANAKNGAPQPTGSPGPAQSV